MFRTNSSMWWYVMRKKSLCFGAAFCLALGGCGFQLADSKGVATRIPQSSLQLIGGSPGFRHALEGRLRAGGVEVVSGDAAAELIVHLDGPAERHKVIGVTTEMDAREYEVGLHLDVRLQRPGDEPSTSTRLSRYRHWVFDAERYLAAEVERGMLKKELQGELLEVLLLHIRAYGDHDEPLPLGET